MLFISLFLTWVGTNGGSVTTGLGLLSLNVGSASKFQVYLPLIIAVIGLVILILASLAALGKNVLPAVFRPFAALMVGAIEIVLFIIFACWNYLGTRQITEVLLTYKVTNYLGPGAYVALMAALFVLICGVFLFLQTRQPAAAAAAPATPAAPAEKPQTAAPASEKKETTISPADRRAAIAQHKADMESVNQSTPEKEPDPVAERRAAIAQHKADMEAVNQPDQPTEAPEQDSELPPKYRRGLRTRPDQGCRSYGNTASLQHTEGRAVLRRLPCLSECDDENH